MTWLPETADGDTELDRVFGLRPELYAHTRAWYGHIFTPPVCDPVILELVRLRVAQLHRCDSELAIRYEVARSAGLDDDKASAVAHWPTDPRFSEAERACLAFAEAFVIDVHSVTDADTEAVRRHLSDPELMGLCNALACYDGFMRVRILLGVGPPAGADTGASSSFDGRPMVVATPAADAHTLF